MNLAPFPGRRGGLRRALVASLCVLLVACGPGVGGSGTGAVAEPLPGTALVPSGLARYADTLDGRQVQLLLEGSRLDVQAACPRQRFSGFWDGQPGTTLRYEGSLDGEPLRRASAELQLDGGTLVVTLRDAAGTVLLGPLPLAAVSAQAPLARCGG